MDESPYVAWLRARVRQLLTDGTLPPMPSSRAWAGPGSGQGCTICGRILTPADTEYELENPRETASIRLHGRCYAVWRTETDTAP